MLLKLGGRRIPAVLQLVVHEVHRPDLIDSFWHAQWLRLLTHQALPGLDAQVEFQPPVDVIHPLVVPAEALHIAQVQVAQTKAPVAVVMCSD